MASLLCHTDGSKILTIGVIAGKGGSAVPSCDGLAVILTERVPLVTTHDLTNLNSPAARDTALEHTTSALCTTLHSLSYAIRPAHSLLSPLFFSFHLL